MTTLIKAIILPTVALAQNRPINPATDKTVLVFPSNQVAGSEPPQPVEDKVHVVLPAIVGADGTITDGPSFDRIRKPTGQVNPSSVENGKKQIRIRRQRGCAILNAGREIVKDERFIFGRECLTSIDKWGQLEKDMECVIKCSKDLKGPDGYMKCLPDGSLDEKIPTCTR